MNPAEAGKLLGLIHLYDNREPSLERAKAWAELLADVPYADGIAAVKHYFATVTDSRSYLVPAHIKAYAKELRRARIEAFTEANPDRLNTAVQADPADTEAWIAERRTLHALVADGTITADLDDRRVAAVVARHMPREIGTRGQA